MNQFGWLLWFEFDYVEFQVQKNPLAEGPSTFTSAVADSEEAFPDVDDDDDELDLDELNELEASLSRISIRIQELDAGISS